MSKQSMKTLRFGLEIKGIDETKGTFEGYASTFNNIDYGFDKVLPGAFKKTIREAKGKFPILADHDPSKQIGWNLEASEDETGLMVKGELLVGEIELAKERYALMKKALEIKAKSGLSIGYSPVKWDMKEEDGIRFRQIKEIRLFEYSFVTFPMNDMAQATAAKTSPFDLWIKGMEGDEAVQVNNFVAAMVEEGFNEHNLKSALLAAAANISKPEPQLAHLFDQGLQKLKFK